MERTDRASAVPLRPRLVAIVGSWSEALGAAAPSDADGNATRGDVVVDEHQTAWCWPSGA